MKSSTSKQKQALFQSDREALDEAANLQTKSKDALHRMQQDLEQTQQVGAMTLDDLYAQRRKLENIESEGDRLHDKLDETEKLQRKLGTWFGGAFQKKGTTRKKSTAIESCDTDQKENGSNNNAEKKKKWTFGKSSKKKASDSKEPLVNVRKGLLEDMDDLPAEHTDELNALAKGDEELDAQLDLIGDQLGNILSMAEDMGTESKNHGRKLGNIQTKLEEAAPRQKKVIKKTQRLLR